jgi:hypothetical protein
VLSSKDVEKLQSKKSMYLPNVNSLLKISLGLILFTIISSALVYAETVTVNVDGTSYDIDYSTTGMTVSGVEADTDFISLIFIVDVTDSPGVLDITFDRSFFDSIFEGVDDDFIILADGDEPTSTETETTFQSRTLNIELPAGTEEVEIIGSSFDNLISIPTDDSDADKAAADKAAADKAAADKAAADKAAADKAAADKAAADKAAADDTPKTQCGPGTILKNGACVLDERCGPGTILKDGACVLDSKSQPAKTITKNMGSEFFSGFAIAIGIAVAVLVVLLMLALFGNQFNKWTN